jgi:hypothetical protein
MPPSNHLGILNSRSNPSSGRKKISNASHSISLIYFFSTRSYKGLDRQGNLARTSFDIFCFFPESYPPVGSQTAKSAFSVHTWCTRKPECTRTAAFTQLPRNIGALSLAPLFSPIHIASERHKEKRQERRTFNRNQESALAMKSALVQRFEGYIACAATLSAVEETPQ